MSLWQVIEGAQHLNRTHGPAFHAKRPHDPHDKTRYKQSKISKYTHWPNPFGKVESIERTMCGSEHRFNIRQFGMLAGSFFIANFVPDPKEVTRKWLTNQYRCGLKFDFNFGDPVEVPDAPVASPLSLIWTDDVLSVYSGSLLPVLEAAYIVWEAGTIVAAMQMYTSVLIEMAACDANEFASNMALGEGEFAADVDGGSPNFYTVLDDPAHIAGPIDGDYLMVTQAGTAECFGHIRSFGRFVDSWEVHWNGTAMSSESVSGGSLAPGESAAWHLSGSQVDPNGGICQPVFTIHQHGPSIAPTQVTVTRFSFNQANNDRLRHLQPRHHDPRCWAPNQPPIISNPLPL